MIHDVRGWPIAVAAGEVRDLAHAYLLVVHGYCRVACG
jgi:hypothetical protein